MSDKRFINGQQLALVGNTGGVPSFYLTVQTDATDSTKAVTAPVRLRVIGVTGVMTGAGGAGDTVAVRNGSDPISATVDVSAVADKGTWTAATIDDAFWVVAAGKTINVVTASSALSFVLIECVRA